MSDEHAGDGTPREEWATRTGEYSPEYYAYYGADETSELIAELLADAVGTDASVLELGCSAGRHLAHLREVGFAEVAGVDVNRDAREVLEETYPGLAEEGQFHFETFQEVLPEFEDGRFDAVFSVQTLQHLPPEEEWLFDEVARVAGSVVLTAESEQPAPAVEPTEPGVNYVAPDIPLYYRDWESVFASRGLEQTSVHELKRETVRVLQKRD